MIRRNIEARVLQALKDTPVVLIHGARQTGKSTLAQWISDKPHPANYLTLDDAGLFSAANSDPAGFLAGFDSPLVIDEVQLAPGLFRAIKREVDSNRQPGRYLLTGSADVMLIPQLSESLAGRMEIHRLAPFSQGELKGVREGFIEALFKQKLSLPGRCRNGRNRLFQSILAGGYPEAVNRSESERRRAWFGSYITTILQRDIRNLADIEGQTQLPRLLNILALHANSLLNVANLSRAAGIAHTTLKRYLNLIEATFLIHLLPAWSGNVRKRLIKTPKVLFTDTGLLGHLLDVDLQRATTHSQTTGVLLENFVGAELLKQISWSGNRPNLFYYRTAAGREVDYLLEDASRRIVAVEVKASSTVDTGDLKGLKDLSETLGDRFHRGVILYTGEESVPFTPRICALPIESLWNLGAAMRAGSSAG